MILCLFLLFTNPLDRLSDYLSRESKDKARSRGLDFVIGPLRFKKLTTNNTLGGTTAPQKSEHSPTNLEIPTAEEIFDKPYPLAPPIPPAWQGDSIAVELANQECERLLVNGLFQISEEDIAGFARQFKISRKQAEIQLRRSRNAL